MVVTPPYGVGVDVADPVVGALDGAPTDRAAVSMAVDAAFCARVTI